MISGRFTIFLHVAEISTFKINVVHTQEGLPLPHHATLSHSFSGSNFFLPSVDHEYFFKICER